LLRADISQLSTDFSGPEIAANIHEKKNHQEAEKPKTKERDGLMEGFPPFQGEAYGSENGHKVREPQPGEEGIPPPCRVLQPSP